LQGRLAHKGVSHKELRLDVRLPEPCKNGQEDKAEVLQGDLSPYLYTSR
jgi:hypothetical protein